LYESYKKNKLFFEKRIVFKNKKKFYINTMKKFSY